MRLGIYLQSIFISAILACSFAAIAQSNNANPEMQGIPENVPSTSVSQPSTADPNAVATDPTSTIKNNTPPGTSSDPTKQFNSGTGAYLQYQLFFNLKQTDCNDVVKITLVHTADHLSDNDLIDSVPDSNTTESAKSNSDYTFTAVTSADKMLEVTPSGNTLSIKIPNCKQQPKSSENKAINDNGGTSQEAILDEADKTAVEGENNIGTDDTVSNNNNVSTNINSVGDSYHFSVMIKVPADVKIIGLSSSYEPGTTLTVNTAGKDPTIMSNEIKTLINVKP